MENENNKSILLIGGGGHCHSVLDTLLSCGQYDRIGIIAKDADNYKELQDDGMVSGYLVGVDEELPRLLSSGWKEAFITLGSIGNPVGRRKIHALLKELGFRIPLIIDKTAAVSKNANIGSGVFVGKNAVINAGCTIGDFAIINTGAIVEHDCRIGSFVHVSPGAVICGHVSVGEGSHIGAGSAVCQEIDIGKNVLIGAGSVVVGDVPDNVKAYGNPCKVVE